MRRENHLLRKLVIILSIPFLCLLPLAAQPTVSLVADTTDIYFGALRLSAATQESSLQVFTERPTDPANPELPPMLGTYRREADQLYFVPRFPFLRGRTYWVVINSSSRPEVISIAIPEATERRPPRLTAIYPSGDVWPANQLKIYLLFDQPMRAGEAYAHFHLLTAEGDTVAAPFADLAAELWNAQQQRLTVWFDPGRIKSGLIPNQKLGPPMLPDRTYQLVISKDWLAANGLSLGRDYVHTFRTGPPDHQSPRPTDWTILPPAAHSHEPLTLRFPEALDYAALRHGLVVLDPEGNPVPGKAIIIDAERGWQWQPESPWAAGRYRLQIHPDLEDLAGNNPLRPFDRRVEGEMAAPPKMMLEVVVE